MRSLAILRPCLLRHHRPSKFSSNSRERVQVQRTHESQRFYYNQTMLVPSIHYSMIFLKVTIVDVYMLILDVCVRLFPEDLPLKRRHLDGSICCSRTWIYFSALMVPFQMCKLPMPHALMQPHTIRDAGF